MTVQLSDKCFDDFIKYTHDLTGISISVDRKSMVEGRIRKRLNASEIDSYESYLDHIQSDSDELRQFVDVITTHETYFFRTPLVWRYMEETLLPDWMKRQNNGRFRAWSAASSSGEEAHSLGVLCEAFKGSHRGFRYEILGSDISEEMVMRSREGKYSGRSLRAFRANRPELFSEYMMCVGDETFQVVETIKNCLEFRQHNLFKPLISRERFDLILLRNVLIYFAPADQEKVISLICKLLNPNGRLIIGESESLSHIETPLEKETHFVYQPRSHEPA
ncbi:MAG TPA: chemotaxis protein [Planctomycetaceae bacterium]|nr:chemotaxis protein [Planctomycetaceae bacterium]